MAHKFSYSEFSTGDMYYLYKHLYAGLPSDIIVHCLATWNKRNKMKDIPRCAYKLHFIVTTKLSLLMQKVLLYTIINCN